MGQIKSEKKFIIVSIGSMLLLYGIFFFIPVGYGIVGSFADWNPIKQQFRFIGFQNYLELLKDQLFWESVARTIRFTIVCTFFTTVLGLFLAVLVSSTKHFQSLFKSCIYLPYITSIISISIVWRWIFKEQGGLLNNILALLGQKGLSWINSAKTVMPSLSIMTIWHDIGFSFILFIAGIAEISPTMYEAAKIDGAGSFQIFRKITLPLISNTMILVLVSNIITFVQVYDQVIALTKGGPGDSSYTATYYLYDKAMGFYRFGYASATAIVLMVLIMLLSILQFKLNTRK